MRLRDALRGPLPDYMLPHQVVVLDTLPLLPNGKIDRKALPAPAVSAPAAASGAPPRNELERQIADAMQAVLKVGDVGIDDDFFVLGGHSLLAARLIAQLNRELELHLSLRTLFEAPTVAQLAQAVASARGSDAAPPRPAIVHAEVSDAPLTLMQDRIHFVERMHPGRVAYHSPSAHRLRGTMDVEAFERAFAELVRRQSALRTAIVRSGDGFVQRIDADFKPRLLPLTDLTTLPGHQREAALLQDMRRLVAIPFALDRAPLFSARLYKLGADHHALFFMAHHVVWDGWSFDILYAELKAHYEAFLAGQPSPLPELPVSYADFARWHQAWMRSDEIRAQAEYWKREHLAAPPQHLPFPDRTHRQVVSGRGATEFLALTPALSEQVRQLARRTGSTVSIVMLSVYAVLIGQWMRDPVPAIGLPVRGRPSPQIEGVMGFFNNMLPLRLPIDAAASGLDWIAQVRKRVTEAIANQDVPFEQVAHELTLSSGSLYQSLFNFQDLRERPTRWGPLEHSRIDVMQEGATENIGLWLVESATHVSGGLSYDADLFLPATVVALRERFVALVERWVASPQSSVNELRRLTPAETAALAAWEQPATTGDSIDVCDAIAAQIDARPDAIALREGALTLSWAELGARVQRAEETIRAGLQAQPGSAGIATDDDAITRLVTGLAALRCGAPAWHALTRAALSTACAGLAERLGPQAARLLVVAGPSPAWSFTLALLGLSRGETLVHAEPGLEADGVGLVALLRAQRVTALHGSATMWRRIVAALNGSTLPITALLDVTEASSELVEALRAAGCRVISLYRPEATGVPVAAAEIGVPDDSAVFGRPLPGATVRIVDPQGERVPPGIAGELHIGMADDTSTLQPTGVLARWRSDGVLQYLGELANTAYVDGHRIDLDAVQARLDRHPQVTRSLAIVRPDRNGHVNLAVYLVPKNGGPTAAAMQSQLRGVVADMLLPRHYPTLGAIPTLANGGVNVAALPQPTDSDPEVVTLHAAASTETEVVLADIWRKLLKVDRVNATDNFFDLGGHSLLAMSVAAEIKARLGAELNLRQLIFESLAQIAASLEQQAPAKAEPVAAPERKGWLQTLVARMWS